MRIRSAEIKYVVAPNIKTDKYSFPEVTQPQIAFVGRSNVGKSSVINKLTGLSKLARTSNDPGKTRQINYFLLDNNLFFVDLPGYGFAKVQAEMRKAWGKLIEQYLTQQQTLKLCVLIIDIRHEMNEFDKMMIDWFENYKISYIILLNKVDKLSNSQFSMQLKYFKGVLKDTNHCQSIIPFSATEGKGKDEVWKVINHLINN
ncbi:MAG: ribosome biogenesis GTP-binding protein YihA/YsxC [Bacteroidota bacterium]|nr:ribosome biogenesis GTP-binding protein YihA/YsxC [Bacteroidota bacterium]